MEHRNRERPVLCESMHLSTLGLLEKPGSPLRTSASNLSSWRDPAPPESSNTLSPFASNRAY